MSSCHVTKCSFSFEFISFGVHQTKPSSVLLKTYPDSENHRTQCQIAIPCEDIFPTANPQNWEHHYLGSDTRYLRGNTNSKHRRQVIQGKGTFKKPASQKPYAHMHVQQEGFSIYMFKAKYICKDKLIFHCYLRDLWKNKFFSRQNCSAKGVPLP